MEVALLYYLRFVRKWQVVCTELSYMYTRADVIAITDNEVIEIEIKRTERDFERDFDKGISY